MDSGQNGGDTKPDPISSEAFVGWLRAAIGAKARLASCARLICGPATPVHLLEVESGSQTDRYVLRLYVDKEWLEKVPDLPRREVVALQEAHRAGLPVPRVIAYTTDSTTCGHPAVLMEHLRGRVVVTPDDLDDWLIRMAETLVKIHGCSAEPVEWVYASYTDAESLSVPGWTKRPDLWREAIKLRLAGPPQHETVFLHRDYHPVNILWTSGELTGVVDWTVACRGPVAVDVAHCCINLATMFGPEVARRFEAGQRKSLGFYSGGATIQS